jgi:hypothetical protein
VIHVSSIVGIVGAPKSQHDDVVVFLTVAFPAGLLREAHARDYRPSRDQDSATLSGQTASPFTLSPAPTIRRRHALLADGDTSESRSPGDPLPRTLIGCAQRLYSLRAQWLKQLTCSRITSARRQPTTPWRVLGWTYALTADVTAIDHRHHNFLATSVQALWTLSPQAPWNSSPALIGHQEKRRSASRSRPLLR